MMNVTAYLKESDNFLGNSVLASTCSNSNSEQASVSSNSREDQVPIVPNDEEQYWPSTPRSLSDEERFWPSSPVTCSREDREYSYDDDNTPATPCSVDTACYENEDINFDWREVCGPNFMEEAAALGLIVPTAVEEIPNPQMQANFATNVFCPIDCDLGKKMSAGACMAVSLSDPTTDEPPAVMTERLFAAVVDDDFVAVRNLLLLGADPNAVSSFGTHILFRTVIKGKDSAIVKLLLAMGADPRFVDGSGNQVLHAWARSTSTNRRYLLDIGRALILAGADLDAPRHGDFMTPLHYVATRFNSRAGWLDFHKAQLLVRFGANIHAEMNDGRRPADSIKSWGHSVAAKRFLELLNSGIPHSGLPGSWVVCDDRHCEWCQ